MRRTAKRIAPLVTVAGLLASAPGFVWADVLTIGPTDNIAGPIVVGSGPMFVYDTLVVDGGNITSGGATATKGGSASVLDGSVTGGLNGDHNAQLSISGGIVDSVTTSGNATLNFEGGLITGALTAQGQSHVTIGPSGGDVDSIKVDPNALLDVINSSISAPNKLKSAGTVDVQSSTLGGMITTTGGTFILEASGALPGVGSTVGDLRAGATHVSILDGSTVGRFVGTGGDTIVVDNSTVGPVKLASGDSVTIQDHAVVGGLNSTGGSITLEGGDVRVIHGDDATIVQIIGTGLVLTGSPGAYVVNGTLEDGTVLHNLKVDVASSGQIILSAAAVPEPHALALGLMALAGFLWRARSSTFTPDF